MAPIDAEMWLLLATTAQGTDDFEEVHALEMAYLTGLQNFNLLPARLLIAAKSRALADKAIQDFVRMDIDFVFAKAPGLKPALLQSYLASAPDNRAFFEEAIAANDPAFLAERR